MSPILSKKSTEIVFTYAPAGFGHLRVVDALYHGLPSEYNPILLGAQDQSINTIHNIVSLHPIIRFIFEWGQTGFQEKLFSRIYRFILRQETKKTYEQLVTIIDQHVELPETVVIIATHFGLAHQIAAIKDKVMKEKKTKIKLIVQVTDDSPLCVWFVEGADMIFVPSEKTKEKLTHYGKINNLTSVRFEVNPYPLNPMFAKDLSEENFKERINQVDPNGKTKINIVLPISGAAVGMLFYIRVMEALKMKSNRFIFHLVSKITPYTQPYLNEMMKKHTASFYLSAIDRDVVKQYDNLYQKEIISLEITKPSEQAFKTLISPKKHGGTIMLFSKPVGRQEYDNLDFLRRHHLIPNLTEQKILWHYAVKNSKIESHEAKQLFEKARYWRGLSLPFRSLNVAQFISWALNNNLFQKMMSFVDFKETNDRELASDGTNKFWEKVEQYLEENPS